VVNKRGKKIYLCGVRTVRNVSEYLRLQRRVFVQGLGRDLVGTLVARRMCTLGGWGLRRRGGRSVRRLRAIECRSHKGAGRHISGWTRDKEYELGSADREIRITLTNLRLLH
jgi:hypothetical protein